MFISRFQLLKMEDTDDEVTSRKRRRRSIRNLRRKSGIVPFCLNEEKTEVEQYDSNGRFHCNIPDLVKILADDILKYFIFFPQK